MKEKISKTIAGLCALIGLTLGSCDRLDVVRTDSARAFGEVLKVLPASGGDLNGITAPDNSARFLWSGEDAAITFDITPFVNAGLNTSKFDNIADGVMVIGYAFQSAGQKPGEPLADFAGLAKNKRSSIGYHAALDHYGVTLGGGNIFEWAKDMNTNDKDIVFVLNPEPFIAAGVDPNRIAGWTFAKVTVDDANGKPAQVDKILKAFNLL